MIKSKSLIVKVGGYIIIGFFTLIIVISFGMPTFMSRMGLDANTLAVVNGDQITRYDFMSTANRLMGNNKGQLNAYIKNMILDRMIKEKLQLQMAKDYGIVISNKRVANEIRNIQGFQDKDGKFQKAYYERYLAYINSSPEIFFQEIKDQLTLQTLMSLFSNGMGVSPEEISFENAVSKSAIQIKVAFLSNADYKKRVKNKLKVSDAEIQEEMKKNPDEVKDPKTDKERIRKKLLDAKFENAKKEFVNSINKLAENKKSFNQAASLLNGKVSISEDFKIGDFIKEKGKKGRTLYALSNSDYFRDNCLSLPKDVSSKVVEVSDGLYLFSPIKKVVKFEEVSEEESKKIMGNIMRDKARLFERNVLVKELEQSKIVRNIKFEDEKKPEDMLKQQVQNKITPKKLKAGKKNKK